jgi:alkanesulfonate monooxygenase SsuD/methylene tetrahydromethanopterin reductase-like flavin-dependent oxidoreductase (luciferase family)
MTALGLSVFPHDLRYSTVATLGTLAEDSGFDGVFVVEAGVSNDAMAMAQAIAMRTRRITVGTGIANLYLRHSMTLGAGAVAIDELSEGRFILGIGVNNASLITGLGLTWREPRLALRDTTAVLRQVFAGETPPGARTPLRRASHPIAIHLAGVALETAELAGEIADGLMCYLTTRTRYQQMVTRMQRGAQQAGREAQTLLVSLLIPTFLSEDLEAARQAARRFLAFYASVPLYARMFRHSGFAADMDAVTQALSQGARDRVAACLSDRLLDDVCLLGPPARCQEQLAAFQEAGVTYPQLAPQAVQEEQETAVRHLLRAFTRR